MFLDFQSPPRSSGGSAGPPRMLCGVIGEPILLPSQSRHSELGWGEHSHVSDGMSWSALPGPICLNP